jgi:signal transduction histidine kinase
VLAWQAYDAARSHRAAAQRALHDYSSLAAWQLAQQTRHGLLTTLVSALVWPAARLRPDSLEQTLMTPYEVADRARRNTEWCGCLDSVEFFFRFDWAERTMLTTQSAASPALLAWARDTVEAYTRTLPKLTEQRPVTFGSRRLDVAITNDSYAMIVAEREGRPRLLAFVVSRDWAGSPVALYGFATSPSAFVAPAIRAAHGRKNPLLPPSLTRGMPEDSIVAVRVTDLAGREIYRSAARFPTAYESGDTLERGFGQLAVTVGLRPGMADRLVVGGLPRSRLPMVLALLVLTMGLIIVALVQLRRQQELVRLRTEFVSGVSHELRTPLAQIRWFAELLHLGRLRTDAERERSLRIIDQEARRLTYLVENVLAFANAERRSGRISPAPLELAREVRDAVDSFAPLARARRATLRLFVDESLVVVADAHALRQILLNLLDNAVKYGPVGQTMIVGAMPVGTAVRLWIDDQGPGIPEGERKRVWEPYVRLGREVEGGTGGSGIGLSVVRDLVAQHGGRVWMEQAPTGGARAVLELPAPAGQESAEPIPEGVGGDTRTPGELLWTSGTWPSGLGSSSGGTNGTSGSTGARTTATPTAGTTAPRARS